MRKTDLNTIAAIRAVSLGDFDMFQTEALVRMLLAIFPFSDHAKTIINEDDEYADVRKYV